MADKLKLQREEGALITELKQKEEAYNNELKEQAEAREALNKKLEDQGQSIKTVASAQMDAMEVAFLEDKTRKASNVSITRARTEYANATDALDKNRKASEAVTDQAIKLKSEASDLAKEFSALGGVVDDLNDNVDGENGDDPVSDITKSQLAYLQQFLQERTALFEGDTAAQVDALWDQTQMLTDIYEAQGKDVTEIIEFYDKKRAKIYLDDETRTRAHYSTMASNFASFLGEFAGGQKAAARLQQVAALIDAYSAANQLYADPKLVALYPANMIAAGTALAAGLANAHAISKSIGEFTSAETGFDGVVNKPTMFMTGESNKAEHVSITPLESPNISGGQGGGGITINVSAPLVDETVLDSILPAIERAKRMNLA